MPVIQILRLLSMAVFLALRVVVLIDNIMELRRRERERHVAT